MVDEVVRSCLESTIKPFVILVDHSNDDRFSYFNDDQRVNYCRTHNNSGFGSGHNIAINQYDVLNSYIYHLVLNPDISFSPKVLSELVSYLEVEEDVGAIMPRISNLDGTLQFARRLLPKPIHILMKRLRPQSALAKKYEIMDMEPETPVEVCGLCGCFILFRCDVLSKAGLFDERFFMYFEDFDLARRVSLLSKVIYYPGVSVVHASNREHRRNLRLLYYLVSSAFKYFNKWGYLDPARNKINSKTIEQIKKSL